MRAKEVTIGLSIVFTGITLVLVFAAIVVTPVAALVAIPFAVAAYLLYGHAIVHLDAYTIAEDRRRTRAAMDDRIREQWPGWTPGPVGPSATGDAGSPGESSGAERDRARSAWAGGDSRYRRRRWHGPNGDRRSRGSEQSTRTGSSMSMAAARDVLGVDTDADQETIRGAYRAGVKERHPDHGGDAEGFRELREAYELLKE